MTPKERAAFAVDETKCVGCGRCVNVCAGMVLHLDEDSHPRMDEFERFGWRGCWGCEHCLAVCPTGAISIFGKRSEGSLRKGDLLFCGAPHLFIAHVKATGKWAADFAVDCNLATAYFELLANAHGLGTIIMSYSSDVLCELAPEARAMLGIPESHYMKLIVGFGYPEVPYVRGVQKGSRKVHRWTDETRDQLPLL